MFKDNRFVARSVSFNAATEKLSWMTDKGEHFTLKLEPAHIILLARKLEIITEKDK